MYMTEGCQLVAAILCSSLALFHLLAKDDDSMHVVLPSPSHIPTSEPLRISEMKTSRER